MPLASTLRERETYADQCDRETQKRYAANYGGDMQKAADPDNWQIIDNWEITEKTYPAKYGYRFTRYFFQQVFNGDIGNVWHWLDEQFPKPDAIDAEYISMLMETAKEYGFFNDGWACVMLGNDVTAYHDNLEESRAMAIFSNATSKDKFYGGRIYRARRKHVKDWLKERLNAKNSRAVGSVSCELDVPENGNEVLSDVAFHNDFTAEEADQVAESEFLGITKGGRFALGELEKSAVTGFIEGLKECGLLSYPNLKVAHAFFGARYGVEVNTDRVTATRGHYRSKTVREVRRLFPSNKPRN